MGKMQILKLDLMNLIRCRDDLNRENHLFL
jgi:hypothetical protein